MVIDNYAIELSGSRQVQSRVEERVSITRQPVTENERNQRLFVDEPAENSLNSTANTSVALSRESLSLQRTITNLQNRIENGNRGLANAVESLFSSELEDADNQQLDADTYQLKSLVESLIGREIELQGVVPSTGTDEAEQIDRNTSAQPQGNTVTVFEAVQRRSESEVSNFSVQGQVQTTDGQVIEIDLSQTLQRAFISEVRLEIISEDSELKDPLVINLPSSTLELTDNRVSFDIDADGELDDVNFATGNSGFLSLDINGNGIIDDGSELFGAISGNGFADLANFDEDGNNFIDEGDSVFTQLQILRKDEEGNDTLTDIQQVGIGALFLGGTSTPFEVRDADNQLDAVVRSSGFYITEDGQAGTLQQIDLVV
jgi:hypothetical protein